MPIDASNLFSLLAVLRPRDGHRRVVRSAHLLRQVQRTKEEETKERLDRGRAGVDRGGGGLVAVLVVAEQARVEAGRRIGHDGSQPPSQ